MNGYDDMAPWPQDVVLHQASGSLGLRWADGLAVRMDGPQLRAACRCAECEQARRQGTPSAPKNARLTALEPVADKGLQLVFSDGHGRGIYPWRFLRQLAQLANQEKSLRLSR